MLKYYKCAVCNLTFKDLRSSIEHKTNTIHTITEEFFPPAFTGFTTFLVDKIEKENSIEILPFEDLPIGESTEPEIGNKKDYYVCLTCHLTFKSRKGAEEHRFNSRHKVVMQNYPIGAEFSPNFGNLEQVRGAKIDHDSFYQRTIDDIPNED